MMTRPFWAGFGVALVVLLLPALILIDARSSGVAKIPPVPPSGSEDLVMRIPARGALEGGNPDLPPEVPLPPTSPAVQAGPPAVDGHLVPSRPDSRETPEIVFSPERIRRSLAHDRRGRERHPGEEPRHSGIRTIVYDTHHVYTVRTAVSHVTLIDLPEEAKEVYLGDAKLFLAEVFGSRVKVKPITYGRETTTNMIVYTVSKQFAFRLKVVPEGEEDDLLTFYEPKNDTVVNLDPIRTVMEKNLEKKEKDDLRQQALATLEAAGPSRPVNIAGVKDGVTGTFLGFSTLDSAVYALFEVRNGTDTPVSLAGIRLRMFRTSLFWEGEREWMDGQDFQQSYRTVVPPRQFRRVLLLADPPPLRSSREGYLAEIRVEDPKGKRRVFSLEARGGPE